MPVLDTTYPYWPPPVDPDLGSPGSFPTHDTKEEWRGDSPREGLVSDEAFTRLADKDGNVRNEEFEMYIMFLPDSGGQWVPLKRVKWRWHYCCTNNGGVWTITLEGASTDLAWSEVADHPKWTENWKDLQDVVVTCPPACP